ERRLQVHQETHLAGEGTGLGANGAGGIRLFGDQGQDRRRGELQGLPQPRDSRGDGGAGRPRSSQHARGRRGAAREAR
ncbi:unnamed protein product, partial [Ectocarpus sp. 8 AP-2014]